MHYGTPAIITLSASPRLDVPDVLTVRLAAWSKTAADWPEPTHIDVSLSDNPGFDLSVRDARRLAAVLEAQSVQAET